MRGLRPCARQVPKREGRATGDHQDPATTLLFPWCQVADAPHGNFYEDETAPEDIDDSLDDVAHLLVGCPRNTLVELMWV